MTEILKHVFLQPPVTPLSPHHPLARTTHLLQVSKAFRELCLPLFFQTVTVGSSSALAALFHSHHGLLVAGDQGRANWAHVQVLCIVDQLHLPYDPHADPDDLTSNGSCPLAIPDHKSIQTLCLLSSRALIRKQNANGSGLLARDKKQVELDRLWKHTNFVRGHPVVLADLRMEFRRSRHQQRKISSESTPPGPIDDFQTWFSKAYPRMNVDDLVRFRMEPDRTDLIATRRALYHTFLVNAAPETISTSAETQEVVPDVKAPRIVRPPGHRRNLVIRDGRWRWLPDHEYPFGALERSASCYAKFAGVTHIELLELSEETRDLFVALIGKKPYHGVEQWSLKTKDGANVRLQGLQ